jgi:hypothetical protein
MANPFLVFYSAVGRAPSPCLAHLGQPRQPQIAHPLSTVTVTQQSVVAELRIIVGAGIGGVVLTEPDGQLTGAPGQAKDGHRGLSGWTQKSGQAKPCHFVVVE